MSLVFCVHVKWASLVSDVPVPNACIKGRMIYHWPNKLCWLIAWIFWWSGDDVPLLPHIPLIDWNVWHYFSDIDYFADIDFFIDDFGEIIFYFYFGNIWQEVSLGRICKTYILVPLFVARRPFFSDIFRPCGSGWSPNSTDYKNDWRNSGGTLRQREQKII